MTQAPITVTYSLEDVLGQLNQKLDRMDAKFETLQKDVDAKFETLQKDMVELKVGQVRLESEIKGEIKALTTEVNGIGKRLDMQEFINRSVVVGFVVAVLAGVVKLFLPIVTSS